MGDYLAEVQFWIFLKAKIWSNYLKNGSIASGGNCICIRKKLKTVYKRQ